MMRMRLQQGMMVCAACGLLAAAGLLQAQEDIESWTLPGSNGWVAAAPAVLSNPGGYLRLAFSKSKMAMPDECLALAGTNASGGVFAGDYQARGAYALSFRFIAANSQIPSVFILRFKSVVSGWEWSYPLAVPPCGVWTNYRVPLSYIAGWRHGPGESPQKFADDLRNVEWVGIYILRGPTTNSADYGLDDFTLSRARNFTIGGALVYAGHQPGAIRIIAEPLDKYGDPTLNVTLPNSGNYSLSNALPARTYLVTAFRDTDGNGTCDFWEPRGAWAQNPVGPLMGDVAGIDIVLADPCSPNGIPYWWWRQYFSELTREQMDAYNSGDTSADAPLSDTAQSAPLPDLSLEDPDGDGMNNFGEYIAGTDPRDHLSVLSLKDIYRVSDGVVLLKWHSVLERIYSVRRSRDFGGAYDLLRTSITGTPPENIYLDTSATGFGPYFYRVQVERE